MIIISSYEDGQSTTIDTRRIGPGLIFERLWRETGRQERIKALLGDRQFQFDMERAIFLTVLHRLMRPGSDRQGDHWREDYRIAGVEGVVNPPITNKTDPSPLKFRN
ncbi:MAG: hypothetical protein HQK55_03880 [Deltaproteobacteria bacterium]|nr:hypothetical protein [Deltaproteobacteria bacterium]